MSADNGIYILKTKDNFKKVSDNGYQNMFGEELIAYRVAHCQGIDNLEYIEKNQPHNLGYYLYQYFGDGDLFYSLEEAENYAIALGENSYCEYGVGIILDYTKYNFPSH